MAMMKTTKISAYNLALQNSAKRRSIIQDGMGRSDGVRSFLSANINKNAALQVQTTEQQLRANSAAAAKVRVDKLNKLNKLA